MPGQPVVIGIDCSTHGAKAIAWTLQGDPVAEGRAGFDLSCPRPGHYEQHAPHWADAVFSAIRQLPPAAKSRTIAVGITHQRETFVGVDAARQPVFPAIVWMDQRAVAQVDLIRAAVGEACFHATTGKPLTVTPSIAKILWLRHHAPDAFRKVARWLDVGGYLAYALAGEDVTSAGSAESMGLVDLAGGRWSDVLLAAAGVDADRLPRIVPAGSVIGAMSDGAAESAGMPVKPPVVVTAGDGQVAAVAAGIFGLDVAYLNLGTAIVSGTVGESLRTDRAFRTMGGAVPGTWLFESDLKGGTFTIDWLVDRLLGRSIPLPRLEREAESLPPGAGGLVLLPYLAGVMNPYWDDDASGVLVGLRGHHGPAHVFRAVLEGIAFEQRLHLREIERATGTAIREIRVLGGGAGSDLWCRILANVLGRPVVRTRSQEATSLGAAMLAAAAVGAFPSPYQAAREMGATARRFEPGTDHAHYDALFEQVYERLYPALQEPLTHLAACARG